MAMPDLQQTVPLKMLHELDMQLFVYLNCLFSLQNWLAHFMLIRYIGENHAKRKTIFESEKRRHLPHFLSD